MVVRELQQIIAFRRNYYIWVSRCLPLNYCVLITSRYYALFHDLKYG